eukprot:CAMPEP_0118925566 /NCGR_PEP_ID=MMETSP1169-20130426/3437_1 /TAXON_ID=36882 /ORGANISM="Pyramimonas obovata, Strain CCMP722" /LENGTH=459 /DNA_ID=CAMNT_0006866901 /DNA_START=147 /DNA_END=1523 /DNA_ORIENTATION=-
MSCVRVQGAFLDVQRRGLGSTPGSACLRSHPRTVSNACPFLGVRSERTGSPANPPREVDPVRQLANRKHTVLTQRGRVHGRNTITARASTSAIQEEDLADDLGQVPVIDISVLIKLLRTDEGDFDQDSLTPEESACLRTIGESCAKWGFFHVVGHGISEDLIQAFLQNSTSFFSMPKEEKYRVKRNANNSRGYFDDELTKQKQDWKEAIDIGAQDGSLEGCSEIDGFNQWPSTPTSFQPVVTEYFEEMTALSKRLLRLIAASLGLPPLSFDYTVEAHTSYLRINHYPPFEAGGGGAAPEAVEAALASEEMARSLAAPPGVTMGIERHTDAGLLTILIQDTVSALQVRKGERWHAVTSPNSAVHPFRAAEAGGGRRPLESTAFTINMGDMLQVLTNDKYVAPLHRVVVNTRGLHRHSAPFFLNPAYTTDCVPLDGGGGAAHYSPVNWGAFRRARFEGDFA